MAKRDSRFVCQSCGAIHSKWMGRCEACGAWNSVIEEAVEASHPGGLSGKGGRTLQFESLDGASQTPPRALTGVAEFDRVLGGGLVAGSAVLVGGDPGIGKSTLLLQAAQASQRPIHFEWIAPQDWQTKRLSRFAMIVPAPQARTCATVPGADSSVSTNIVWIESMTMTSGASRASRLERTSRTEVVAASATLAFASPSRAARRRT